MIPLPTDSRAKDWFERAGNEPAAWFLSADSLLAAARVLVEQYRAEDDQLRIGSPVPREAKLIAPAFLLYGFAIECLLKARWLSKGNRLVDSENYIGMDGLKGHDLGKMAAKVGFELSANELSVLTGLSVKLTGSARYPVGTKWDSKKPVRLPNRGFSSREGFSSADIKVIEIVATRLLVELGYDA
jgi:hypothetical protein